MSILPGEVPPILSDVDALLRGRFHTQDVRCVRVGTHYRFLIEKPGDSRMFGITDSVIACHKWAGSLAQAMLDVGCLKAIEDATPTQVVMLTSDGIRVDYA